VNPLQEGVFSVRQVSSKKNKTRSRQREREKERKKERERERERESCRPQAGNFVPAAPRAPCRKIARKSSGQEG